VIQYSKNTITNAFFVFERPHNFGDFKQLAEKYNFDFWSSAALKHIEAVPKTQRLKVMHLDSGLKNLRTRIC
jgi:hypothetical protein